MDDIEVWLRTDLVRLDFYMWCVGWQGRCSSEDRPWGFWQGLHLHNGGLEEGGEGSSAKLTFLSNTWSLVVLALGTASQPHSSVQMWAGPTMSHTCGHWRAQL